MKIKEFKNKTIPNEVNKVVITGKIISNKDNTEFGDNLYALNPFGGESVAPLMIESNTPHIIETDDGIQDTKKNIFNVNAYGDLATKITTDESFYIGCQVQVTGYFISKNFSKTEERIDIMNLCNRYKNVHDGERPMSYEGDRLFVDKSTGLSYTKYYIDWYLLLAEGLLDNIPDEEEQNAGKVEYFYIDDGRVFKQEHKTNYIIIANEIDVIDGFVDVYKGDENFIEISGTGKDIFTHEYDGYHTGHICLICKTEEMTRNSYIHILLKGKNLDILKLISTDDKLHIIGKIKHRVIEKSFTKKKGKKEIVIKQFSNAYEIDCKDITIYKK